MLARRIVAWLSLPLLIGFDAFAWYGVRYAMWMYLIDAGMTTADVGWWSTATTACRVGAFVVGAVVAGVIAPSAAVVAGGVLLSLGTASMAAVPPELVPAAWMVSAVGSGVTTVGLWAAAASAHARPAHQLRNGLFLAMYATVQFGAGAAGVGYGFFESLAGPLPWFALCGAVAAVAAVVALVAGLAHWVMPAIPEDDLSRRLEWGPVAVSVGVLVLASVPWTAWWLASGRLYQLALATGSNAFVYSAQPWMVLLCALCGMLVALVLHALNVDVPALLWVGLAFVFGAVGIALGSVAAFAGSPMVAVVSLALLAGAEAPANALLLSRIAGDVHWRLSAMLLGIWLLLSMGLNLATSWLVPWSLGTWEGPLLLALAGLVGVFGVVALMAAFPVQWRVLGALDPPEELLGEEA